MRVYTDRQSIAPNFSILGQFAACASFAYLFALRQEKEFFSSLAFNCFFFISRGRVFIESSVIGKYMLNKYLLRTINENK